MSKGEQLPEDPVLQQFSKDQMLSRAKEFMRLRFGPVDQLPPADKRSYHELAGVLMFYINHLWGEWGGG